MTVKYFVEPFANAGDVAAIPDPTQGSGVVSYEEGFGAKYQLVDSDPSSLNIPRDQFNQLMLDITGAIQQIQQNGIPYFITTAMNDGSPFPYTVNAIVYQPSDGNVYQSTIGSNTNVPPGTGWQLFGVSTSLWLNFAADTGIVNAYAVAPSPAITAYAAGQVVLLKPILANTGACTLQVNGLASPVPIKTLKNVDPTASMMIPSGTYILAYNATTSCFVLCNPTLGSAAYIDVGTAANQILQLNGSAQIPAVSGALLTGLLTGTAAAAGKIVLPTLGITIQWGTGTATTTYRATFIPFNVNFSGAPYYVNFVPIKTSSPPNFTTGTQNTPNISGAGPGNILDGTGFYAQMQDNGTAPCIWLAIGPT